MFRWLLHPAKLAGRSRSDKGFSLVEVLVSMLLFTVILLPTIDAVQVSLYAARATHSRSVMLGLARIRTERLIQKAYDLGITSLDAASEEVMVTGADLTGDPDLSRYEVRSAIDLTDYFVDEDPAIDPPPVPIAARQVVITVSCPTCKQQDMSRDYTLSTVVRGGLYRGIP